MIDTLRDETKSNKGDQALTKQAAQSTTSESSTAHNFSARTTQDEIHGPSYGIQSNSSSKTGHESSTYPSHNEDGGFQIFHGYEPSSAPAERSLRKSHTFPRLNLPPCLRIGTSPAVSWGLRTEFELVVHNKPRSHKEGRNGRPCACFRLVLGAWIKLL